MEIERKFLVTDLSTLDLSKYEKKKIIQDYLYQDEFTVVRKRRIIKNGEEQYKYTIKTGKSNFSVNEIEKNITIEQYNNLSLIPTYQTLEKLRYNIPYINNLIIELDVFLGAYEGIIFAEIEFQTEEQAKSIELPKWFGKELSSEVTNSMMATMNVENIKKRIYRKYLKHKFIRLLKCSLFFVIVSITLCNYLKMLTLM